MKKLILLLLLLSACAENATWRLQEDNDIFKLSKNNDRYFSQGLRVSRTTPDETGSHTYLIGQNFYTPGLKKLTESQPDDRPYAAFLYGGYYGNYNASETAINTFGLHAGIVGPHAYGKETQNNFHKLIGDNPARGWGNQIHDEPGVILIAERNSRLPVTKYFDLVNTLGANAGNVMTQGYAGFLLRLGYNLPLDPTKSSPLFPRVSRTLTNTTNYSYYIFGGATGRLVGRNIFLDGNTWEDSNRVTKKLGVLEGRLGGAIDYKKYALAYTYIPQTDEFKGQKVAGDFGEISLSAGF